MSANAGHDDNVDHAQAMIDWLSDKGPDVWFEVTQHLNWDSAERVLDWIVSQPDCDRANAAYIFWGTDPLYYIRTLATGAAREDGDLKLARKIIRQWNDGFYKRAELSSSDDHRASYLKTVDDLPDRRDRLGVPQSLLGPLPGRDTQVPDYLRAEHNAELWDLLDALGTHVGFRPGGDEWKNWRNPKWRQRHERKMEREYKRAGILSFYEDIFRFFFRSLPWLFLFAVVAIGGAFLLRFLEGRGWN